MRTLESNLAAAIAAEEIQGLFWLVQLDLPGGTQYFSESGIFEWNSHTWQPFLDPDSPHDGLKYNLKCDEKLETSINLINVNHGISDLFATNDPQGCVCKIYIYHEATGTGQLFFRGIMGKPERLTDTVISVPVSSYLHGPLTKLPSRVFCRTCGMEFADGLDCPYNPAGGFGRVDPGTGLPYTYCPKTSDACTARGMRGTHTPLGEDYFAGFEKWRQVVRGKLNNSGALSVGRKSYTSESEVYDNFLGKAVPIVYGQLRLPGIVYFQTDESEFRLVGAFIGEGQLQEATEILVNGQPTHDFKYPSWFTHGFPGQEVPEFNGYTADPFSGTAAAVCRIVDEVGLQPDRSADLSWRGKGRTLRQYYYSGGQWLYNDTVYSNDPIDVWMDLLARRRGGLGLGYDVIAKTVCNERTYSGELIWDVDNVQRKRYQFNGAILDHQPAGDVLERIRDEFSMFYRDYGDSITFGFIRPSQSSMFTFSEASRTLLVDEETGLPMLEVSEKSFEDVPNRVYFSFLDETNNWEKTTFHLESQEQIERAGRIVDESRFLLATTSVGQAMRVASNWLERAISGNWYIELSAAPKALAVEVGDVVTVADGKIPGGSDTFLVTGIEIGADFSLKFEGQLYRSAFYDDTVDDAFGDLLRGTPENPLRLPGEVTHLTAQENIVEINGVPHSEIVVTWVQPDPVDPLWLEAEIWFTDTLAPDKSWNQVATGSGTEARFYLPFAGYRMIEIRVRSVSRYGVRRGLDSAEIPEIDLLVDCTPDTNVPDAPANLQVLTREDDGSIPPGFFRVIFDAGAHNWAGVHTLYIECNPSLPFSDGTLLSSNGVSVSGSGVIDAGGTAIYCEGKTWTPHDPALVGQLAIVTDGGGNVQARLVADNTADTIITNGPWYLPDGSYLFDVRSDFTKANYRGFMYTAQEGGFSPADRSYQFDLPLSDISLYFRVTAFNAYGKSPWATTPEVITSSSVLVDMTPAPLVDNFNIAADGFVAPDGPQKVWCIVDWDAPNPAGNFGHLLVLADYPIEAGMGIEAGSGGYAGEGYYNHRIGEYWDPGQPFVSIPTGQEVIFYAISVNTSGYYDPDWYANGKDQPGGYRECRLTLTADNTAPPAPESVTATYASMGGAVRLVWEKINIPDLRYYEVEMKTAETQGGLDTADWVSLGTMLSTIYSRTITPPESGDWFRFRVRAVDTLGTAGTWGYSGDVQAYAAYALQPVAAPNNLEVTGSWRYAGGVGVIDLAINWDNPLDGNYGGSEVWILNLNGFDEVIGAELLDREDAPGSNTTVTLIADGRRAKIALYPYNKGGVVPDYSVILAGAAFNLTPEAFATVTVPAPDITAMDGVGCVHIIAELPAWAGHNNPYELLALYISPDANTANAVKVAAYPVGNVSDGTEADVVKFTVPFQALSDISGTWTQGTNYHFFGKLADKFGVESAFSADTNNTAVFIHGDQTDVDVADFGSGAEVMRFAASDRQVMMAWWAPTVNGTTVYEVQIQVATSSAFSTLLANVAFNLASGSWTFAAAANGTFYFRIRYRNNSPSEWSEWFGRVEGTAYAAVQTIADQAGDTGKMSGTDVEYQTTDLTGKDNIQLDVRLKSTAANAKTCYNISVIWSATLNNTKDEENVYQSGLTAAWQDNDSWVAVNTTPATAWIGKVLQFYSATNVWDGWIITQIDAASNRVQLNGSFGAAKSGQTARVITPYWQRPNTWFKELGRDAGWHLDKSVWYPTTITEIPSGATCYVRLIPCNVYGTGTVKDISFTIPDEVGNIAEKGQGYANDTAPAGSFSNSGYTWEKTSSFTADFVKTFTFTQSAASYDDRADSFVICIRPGGGTPDPTADRLAVFPVTHLSGAQNYELRVTNLDPFATYSFTLYQAKNTASGLAMNTTGASGKELTDSDLECVATDNLLLKASSRGGAIRCEQYNSTTLVDLYARGLVFASGRGISFATSGYLLLDDGTEVRLDTPIVNCYGAQLQVGSCAYTKPLLLGTSRLWVDGDGKLRIKTGSNPSSDTDGTIVGTQS